MPLVLRIVCIVLFLSVHSVPGHLRMVSNRSQSTSPTENVDVITPSSGNSTSSSYGSRRQVNGGRLSSNWDDYDYDYGSRVWIRHHFGFLPRTPRPAPKPPKQDPWPDRPHTLNNSMANFTLRKCCYNYTHLNDALLECKHEDITKSPRPWLRLPLNASIVGFPPCAAHDVLRLSSVEASDRLRFSDRGTLLLRVEDVRVGSREVELERDAACADVVLGMRAPFGVLLCPCRRTACVRKCCGRSQALAVREASVATVTPDCQEMTTAQVGTWNVQVDPRPETLETSDKEGYIVLPNSLPPNCKWGWTRGPPSWATPKPGEDFRVYDGGLAIINTRREKRTDNFCVDGESLPNELLSPSVVFCADPVPVPVADRWMAALGVVGALALAAAVAVHALLPELRATPFGRALAAYAAALFVFAVIGLAWTLLPDVSRARCILNVIWSQYFMHAAAFWLNVMCYDIGIAFSSYKRTLDKTGKMARRRYIRYAQYAWGCPFIAAIPVVALQVTHSPGSPWRPIEWFMKCHYSSHLVQWIFLYTPLLLLLILNCTIFVWTAYRIRALQKDAEILTECDEESLYPPRKRLLLFLKLLWLMGVGETLLELIASSVSAKTLWYTANIVDFSRAICVFWLSCCKDTVLRRLRDRFRDRLCCESLRRGSRVGPDPDADAATAAAAARGRTTDATDSTVFSATDSVFDAQAPNLETAAQDETWDIKSTQAMSATQVGNSTPPNARVVSSPNGVSKGATPRGVIEKEADKDCEPPPDGVEMKVLSTTSL